MIKHGIKNLYQIYSNSTVSPDSLILFRNFFFLYLCCWTINKNLLDKLESIEGVIIGIAIPCLLSFVGHTKRWRIASFFWLIIIIIDIVNQFPGTPNHVYIQSLVLVSFILFYPKEIELSIAIKNNEHVSAVGKNFIQGLIFMAFFISGIQKLLSGYWLSGEFIGTFILFGRDHNLLSVSLQYFIEVIASFTNSPISLPLPRPQTGGFVKYNYPTWISYFSLFLSLSIITLEIVLPIGLIIKRTKKLFLKFMIVLQVSIAGVTGVFGFLLLGTGMLLLYTEESKLPLSFKFLTSVLIFLTILTISDEVYQFIPWVWG
jgi:hypothetical protein